MNEKNKCENWEYGMFIALGLVFAATGIDLTGRLLHFLYGEWQYICIGLVVLAFLGINVYVHAQFNNAHWEFQKDVDNKIEALSEKIYSAKSDWQRSHSEIEFMKGSMQEYWKHCSETIKKAEKLIEEKTPIVVNEIKPIQEPLEPNGDMAVQEVTGGVI